MSTSHNVSPIHTGDKDKHGTGDRLQHLPTQGPSRTWATYSIGLRSIQETGSKRSGCEAPVRSVCPDLGRNGVPRPVGSHVGGDPRLFRASKSNQCPQHPNSMLSE